MAIVKIKFIRHMEKLAKYVLSERGDIDPVDSHDCIPAHVVDDFNALAKVHNGKGEISAIHIVQSWGEAESQKLPADQFNAMGRELVEKKFPGHAFMIVTHTETKKVHNHIVVSPWHSETGKKIENKKRHLYELRNINDAICKERGLSVINEAAKDRQARLPQKVQAIERYRGKSWIVDLVQKVDFARAFATSHDEYASILFEFGVIARTEDKNITYYYGTQKRGKRGSKLGLNYDKKGLEEAFRQNDIKFARNPGLLEKVRGTVRAGAAKQLSTDQVRDELRQIPGTTYSPGIKDYSRFTKVARQGRGIGATPKFDDAATKIPIEEIRRARNSSIFAYCRANKIELTRTSDGKMLLRGREAVEVGEFGWQNTRNRTNGSLIEFVAFHRNCSLLQAIAHINNNPRLLILEKTLGEVNRKFTSFYIPKEKKLRELDAKVSLAKLLTRNGVDPSHAAHLFKTGQAQVGIDGRIRLFGKEDDNGAFEFVEHQTGDWKRQKLGEVRKPFFEIVQKSKNLVVYLDPFSFLAHQGKHAFWSGKYGHDVLCLMEPNDLILDQHLAKNRQINEIQMFHAPGTEVTKDETDFINRIKIRAIKFGITVNPFRAQERAKGRETDLPSF